MTESRWRSSRLLPTCTLIGMMAILCHGCTSDGLRGQASRDRESQRVIQLLIAAGDADSLAAAAMLSFAPTVDNGQRLSWIARAVSEAPDRPDLVWLDIRLCAQVASCDPESLEPQLRALDPENGAAWFDSLVRAEKHQDVAAVRKDLAAIATSKRFDLYWNSTVVHLTNAILRTHTLDVRSALWTTTGVASADIPAYHTILETCTADSLRDPEVLRTCRQVSAVLRAGDTYLTEMIGPAIAKRAWPETSSEYVDAAGAKRLAHYRMDADAKLGLHRLFQSGYAARRLRLMTQMRTEQEVIHAELVNAKLNPDPPPAWVDERSGS